MSPMVAVQLRQLVSTMARVPSVVDLGACSHHVASPRLGCGLDCFLIVIW